MSAVSKLTAALRELGPTAEAVAKNLKKASVRGVPYDMCGCPLAVYLTQRCGAPVRVGREVAVVELVRVRLGEPVRAFIDRFERGEWAEDLMSQYSVFGVLP